MKKNKKLIKEIYSTNPYYQEKYKIIKAFEKSLNLQFNWKKIKITHIDHLNEFINNLSKQTL